MRKYVSCSIRKVSNLLPYTPLQQLPLPISRRALAAFGRCRRHIAGLLGGAGEVLGEQAAPWIRPKVLFVEMLVDRRLDFFVCYVDK